VNREAAEAWLARCPAAMGADHCCTSVGLASSCAAEGRLAVAPDAAARFDVCRLTLGEGPLADPSVGRCAVDLPVPRAELHALCAAAADGPWCGVVEELRRQQASSATFVISAVVGAACVLAVLHRRRRRA
jgi:hypothetical protein